jgi:uncharacterized protein
MIETALFVTGILCGMVNAVAGGGILFVFPVLLAAGLSPLSAAMTSTFAGWPGALTSVQGYSKDLKKVPKHYFWLIVPCALGAGTGAYILTRTPHSTFETILPWLILFSVLLFTFQPQLHKHIHKPKHMRKTSPLLLLALLLLPVALYGGYFGAGFGFIVLAILSFTKLKTIYQLNGMKNVMAASISFTCAVTFTLTGGIAWEYALAPLAGSLLGGFIGARVAHRLSPHVSRAAVVSTGFCVVGLLFFKVI